MQKYLLAAAVFAGLFLAYVDALPTWDDSGVLAAALLMSAALVTVLGQRRPWLVALAVGLWIPVHDIYRTHDFRMLLVLLIPFAGAYIGWGARRAIGLAMDRSMTRFDWMRLAIVAALTLAVNLPFGFWRAGVRKFSLSWFVAVHGPVPLIVMMRLVAGLGWRLSTFPVLVGAFFGGQLLGGRMRAAKADQA